MVGRNNILAGYNCFLIYLDLKYISFTTDEQSAKKLHMLVQHGQCGISL